MADLMKSFNEIREVLLTETALTELDIMNFNYGVYNIADLNSELNIVEVKLLWKKALVFFFTNLEFYDPDNFKSKDHYLYAITVEENKPKLVGSIPIIFQYLHPNMVKE
jgi:hypothetical protein